MKKPTNPMELVDRYLQAVRFWLPKEQQEDILAELSEDLRSQIDEKETELGRKLNEGEIDDLLQQRGRPLLVATRYLPPQYLIGPVLLPIYLFVLKLVALCYVVPWAVVWVGMMFFDAAYRAEHTGAGWPAAIGSAWNNLLFVAFFATGAVTIIFAILERAQARSHFLQHWSPRKLPPLRDEKHIPRSGSIVEVVVNQAFCIWWATYMFSNVVLERPEIRIVLSSRWQYFFWSFLFLGVANIGFAAVNLVRPYWTVPRATLRLASNAIASLLFCWMLKASILAKVALAHTSAVRTVEITNTVNFWLARAFPIALIAGVAIAAVDVHRIFRVKTFRARLRPGIASAV